MEINKSEIKEFHLFAGIGGGIYGGELLGHKCCGGVEILPYAQTVLRQRQKDRWMNEFPIYDNVCTLDGKQFKGEFDILCGGFPCQAFSTAAHGKNISEKNLWGEMLRFVKESEAPIVFGENVVIKAIDKARQDLEECGYKVEYCKLSCSEIGADHQRNRFWLLAVKDFQIFDNVAKQILSLPKLTGNCWSNCLKKTGHKVENVVNQRRNQLLGVGNAQSPLVAATAFRILVNRHLNQKEKKKVAVSEDEINEVFIKKETWIRKEFGNIGYVHTPTTMANYSCPSMMKHLGCRNFKKVFGHPEPDNAEYLMGLPIGASSISPLKKENYKIWMNNGYE